MIGLPSLSTLIWRFVKCSALSVSLNVRYSDFSIDDIALNPRIHPVNDVGVFPVYVIISSSILKRPYWSGYPSVVVTGISSSKALIEES